MKKTLAIIGGIFCGVILIGAIVLLTTILTSNKLVCESKEGNITIMYNDKTITGYTAKKISYNMDNQKALAEKIGTEEYVKQFEEWFKTNTTGTCTKKSK